MADYSTEELEKIADKFRSDTSGIRGTKDFTSPEELYDELKKEIKKYHPSDDTSLVDKAYRVAYDAHKGQARKSGEPYIIHPHFLRGIECKVRADLPVFNQHITAACGGGHILPAGGAGDLKRHLLAHDHASERGERAFIGGIVRNSKQEAVFRDLRTNTRIFNAYLPTLQNFQNNFIK